MAKNKAQINKTYILITLILSLAIIVFGALSYKTEQLKIDRASREKVEADVKLDVCLKKAEATFERVKNINSVSSPKPGYSDARQWNNNEVAASTQKRLEDDKSLCAKLYGIN